MISWRDKVFFDNVFSFGATSSPGVFGRLADLLVKIFKHHSVEDILKWVDDFVFFRSPTGEKYGRFVYKYDESIFFDIAEDVGMPWEIEKHTPFNVRFSYLGFEWCLATKTVWMGPKKIAKYLEKMGSWIAGGRVTKKEVENIIGTLNHCALVIPEGRPRLVSFYRLVGSFSNSSNPFVKYSIPHDVGADATWWRGSLANHVPLKIREPPPPKPAQIFVDASTSWGIGFSLENRWLAWKFIDGWYSDGRHIGWREMVAVELALRALIASGAKNAHYVLRSDNKGVIGALAAGRSHGIQANAILQHILRLFYEHDIWLTIEYVPTKENIADAPSRGEFPPRKFLFPYPPKTPKHLRKFLIQITDAGLHT